MTKAKEKVGRAKAGGATRGPLEEAVAKVEAKARARAKENTKASQKARKESPKAKARKAMIHATSVSAVAIGLEIAQDSK